MTLVCDLTASTPTETASIFAGRHRVMSRVANLLVRLLFRRLLKLLLLQRGILVAIK